MKIKCLSWLWMKTVVRQLMKILMVFIILLLKGGTTLAQSGFFPGLRLKPVSPTPYEPFDTGRIFQCLIIFLRLYFMFVALEIITVAL